jgi:hypothetical protein
MGLCVEAVLVCFSFRYGRQLFFFFVIWADLLYTLYVLGLLFFNEILLVKKINLKFKNQNLILLLFSLEFCKKLKIQENIPFLFHFSTPLATPKPTSNNP